MTPPSVLRPLVLAALAAVLAGCATRPVNPPIAEYKPDQGYQYFTRPAPAVGQENLVILAFSGGGTRAAAFSYGVLEFLRRTEAVDKAGRKVRLLDAVDIVTGVSGGSFTALAYGLYGDKLFDEYEQRFLKRNVQGELTTRFLNPANWGNLWSTGWGRSELAADFYDEILFNGATFDDLARKPGPFVTAVATDLSTGSRFGFTQNVFNVLCADLGPVRLSRAAAASSAVPVVLSPVTINNYGGKCGYRAPAWTNPFADPATTPRPAARVARHLQELLALEDGVHRPYIHLVDGGVSDNLALRGVLEIVEGFEALHALGKPTPLDRVRRIVVIVVNSLSSPKTNWDESEEPPGLVATLLKATGVPIDRNSYEAVELLKDIEARWRTLRRIHDSPAYAKGKDPSLIEIENAPDVRLYAIDVSFARLADQAELEYLNGLPTSFVLPAEAVDRLRAAAGKIIADSPEFRQLLKDVGAQVVAPGAAR